MTTDAATKLKEQATEAACVNLHLPDLLRGPKHAAELIMAAQREEARIRNDGQHSLFALWMDTLQEASTRRPNPEEPDLALGTWLFDIVVG